MSNRERAQVAKDGSAAHHEVLGQIARGHTGPVLQQQDEGKEPLGAIQRALAVAHKIFDASKILGGTSEAV